MKVESIIKRDPPTKLVLGPNTYEFQPDSKGRHVCEVNDQQDLARLLSIPEGYRLVIEGEQPVQVPQQPEQPVVQPLQPTLQPNSEGEDDLDEDENEDDGVLYGSNVHPALIDLGNDRTVQLGEVVQKAFADSGMTTKEWNEQDEDDRYAKIDACLDAMAAPADEEEDDPADTNGDGVVDSAEEREAAVKDYEAVFGKKPHGKWKVARIREEIAKGNQE